MGGLGDGGNTALFSGVESFGILFALSKYKVNSYLIFYCVCVSVCVRACVRACEAVMCFSVWPHVLLCQYPVHNDDNELPDTYCSEGSIWPCSPIQKRKLISKWK